METSTLPLFRDQLLDRRRQLEGAAATPAVADQVHGLLQEVDAALGRIDAGTFGLCAECHDAIETDRLLADPLIQFCLDHLTPVERRALEHDLELAARIQRELLPKPDARLDGWEIAQHYRPAGPVSGDFLDVIPCGASQGFLIVGDAAGKGVAAAMLMSHVSAMLRALISVGLPISQVVERASRVLCESTLPTSYATLVCARTGSSGEIEVCNAGHPPPLVVRPAGISRVEATGLPIGLFCSGRFSSQVVQLAPGDTLLLYSDGLIEAENPSGNHYGIERLSGLAASAAAAGPRALVASCLRDVASFCGASNPTDDLTIMAVQRR